jgi:hypothetical protein
MAGGSAQQLEGLISSQKEIISATWNLERRSAAGRSSTDIRNVAEAQAELKGRAEQAAGAARQRRRIGQDPPQQQALIPPPPGLRQAEAPSMLPSGGDPVRDAVEAMTRALQQLETRKTAEAIPHEMAALNALLQAQAAIRKRQLTQQQNAGGGNGNRQGQDLSNLFDRELKRQQQTNYETKAQVEAQPEGSNADSALDRIKDLARRQEEVSRRQRDLAKSGVSAEELKRQLEKLTREQEELRRQAEEAVKEMAQQGSRGSRGSTGSTGSGSGGSAGSEPQQDLNRALEQMRRAATQGRQDDAAGAAASGEEAARQLRRAESRMQQGSPDAKRRALGDLQLESQQIAETERRIAREAERLDREGGGAADARRRLAGEKEQLADRVDALQQSAQRLGSEQKGEGAAAAEAARDLAAQRLGPRMRAGAQRLRDGKDGKTAASEQQIADALDTIARRMNGADAGGAKGDAQKLADQLDQVRGARERLARLEKQIADAKQAAEGARGGNGVAQPGRAGQDGPQGRQGQRGSQGDGQAGGDLARLQQEYNKELQRTRDVMDRVQRGTPQSGGKMTTPEEHEWSRSAPGTEAFKQDYAAWQSLAGDVARSLERTEAAVAGRLSTALVKDRLRAGGSERVPDAYRARVSKYFESLASSPSPPIKK